VRKADKNTLKNESFIFEIHKHPAHIFLPLIPLLKTDEQRLIILRKLELKSSHKDRRFALSDFTVLCRLSSTTKKEIDFGGSCRD
jgi:hypothetical protein